MKRLRWSLLLCLLAGSCGGGSTDSSLSDSSGVGEAFAKRAVAVCQRAADAKAANGPFPFPDFNPTAPDESKFPVIATVLAKMDAVWASWYADMSALGRPPEAGEAWDDLLEQIKAHREINLDQIDAARHDDADRFAEDYQKGTETQDRLLAAATAAGVPKCAEVDR